MINSISRSFLIAVFLSVGLHSSHAQSNPADEKLEKVNSLLKKNNIDAADKKLISLLEEHSSYGKGWDLLAKIRDHQYEESRKMPDLFSNLSVTVVDSTDNEVKSDSMEINLKKLLSQMSPEKKAYNNYLYTLRQAMLYSENAYYSSIYLRSALRDIEVDSALSTKELTYFKKAEEEFRNKNFNKAAKYYQRALDINPNFYKALLYLGDSYYSMGNYIEAIKNFKICVNRYPMLLEPRKYLVDAYFKEGLFEDALRESINCILVYPDLSIIKRFEYAAFESGLDRFVHLNKANFIGRDALVKWQQEGFNNKMVTLEVFDVTDADALGNNAIYKDGEVIGRATGGNYGFRVKKSLAIAMVEPKFSEIGTELEMDILDRKHKVVVIEDSPYDPMNEKIRA